jgi:hypothetical protein
LIKIFTKSIFAIILFLTVTIAKAQLSPITFEPGAYGNTWTWTTFENATNPPVQVVANPNPSGINTSNNVIKMTTLVAGNPWAGFESLHGAGIGTFTLNNTNCIVKIMVYKSVISDVGVKFATAAGASTGEIKVPNTKINEWEELTFNFSGKIGEPSSANIDQIIFFPDFTARTTDNICYIDNVVLGSGTGGSNINVKFAVQAPDSLPVFVFGNWNTWNNFPGTPMVWNASTASYEATLPFTANSTIEYLYVNGNTPIKEVLNSAWTCTNGNAQYTNRMAVLGATDITLCNIWKTCNPCNPASVTSATKLDIGVTVNTNFIQINANTISKVDGLEIFDMLGQKVFGAKNVTVNTNIPVSLHQGMMYIIKVSNDHQVYNTKFIVAN